jgi:hypothetical protein
VARRIFVLNSQNLVDRMAVRSIKGSKLERLKRGLETGTDSRKIVIKIGMATSNAQRET